ncbi:MAG TPA: hypothetical protein DF712_06760, partial [Balneola sp.]|nr:hypothetical protein [Balneola sp.]
ALFENGKIILPYRTEESRFIVDTLCSELYGLGKEKHDDTVMSLWIAECAMRSASFEYAVSFGEGLAYDNFGKRVYEDEDKYSQQAEDIHNSKLWSSFEWNRD